MDKNNRIANAGILLLAAILFVICAADDSEAATYNVDSLGGSDYTNITQAVENASAGDTINIAFQF